MRALLRGRTFPAALVAAAAALMVAAPARAILPGGPGYYSDLNQELTTQDGKKVRFYDDLLKNKAVLIDLIYTHCSGSCPLETAKLSQVQKILADHMGKDLFIISLSIDPAHDTPEVLKAYAEKFHTGPGWTFLTGKKEDIKLIAKKLGLTSLTDAANADGHQPSLLVGRENTGHWMMNSAVDNPRFLARTISTFLFGYKAVQQKSYADMGPVPVVTRGEYLFRSRCTACHSIGKGDMVGPDLLGITKVRDAAWLKSYIRAPDQVLASGDPIAKALFKKYKEVRMPNTGLSELEADAVIPYIDDVSRQVDALHAKTAALK